MRAYTKRPGYSARICALSYIFLLILQDLAWPGALVFHVAASSSEDNGVICREELYRFENLRDWEIPIKQWKEQVEETKHVDSDCPSLLDKVRGIKQDPNVVSDLHSVDMVARLGSILSCYNEVFITLYTYIQNAEKIAENPRDELREYKLAIFQAAKAFEQMSKDVLELKANGTVGSNTQDLFKMLTSEAIYKSEACYGGRKVRQEHGYYEYRTPEELRDDQLWGRIHGDIEKNVASVVRNMDIIIDRLSNFVRGLRGISPTFAGIADQIYHAIRENNGDKEPYMTQREINATEPSSCVDEYKRIVNIVADILLDAIEEILITICTSSELTKSSVQKLPLGTPIALSGAYEREQLDLDYSDEEDDRDYRLLGRLDYDDGTHTTWKYSDNDKEPWIGKIDNVRGFSGKEDTDLHYELWQSSADISSSKPGNVLYTTGLGHKTTVSFDPSDPVYEFMSTRMVNVSGSLVSRLDPTDPADRIFFLDKRQNEARICAVDGLTRRFEEPSHFCGPVLDPCVSLGGPHAFCANRSAIAVALSNGAIAFICTYSLRPLPYMIAPRCKHCHHGPARPVLIRWCCKSNVLVVLYRRPHGKGSFINIYALPCDRPDQLAEDIESPTATINLDNIVTFSICCCPCELFIYVLTNPCYELPTAAICTKGPSMIHAYAWTKAEPSRRCRHSSQDAPPTSLCSSSHSEDSCEPCSCEPKKHHLYRLARAELPGHALFMEPYPFPRGARRDCHRGCKCCRYPVVVYSRIMNRSKALPSGLLQLVKPVKNRDSV